MVSYANGLRMSLQARERLRAAGLPGRRRILDLRWLNPLPFDALNRAAAEADAVLVVDECRATGGGVADAVIAHLAEAGFRGPLRSVRSRDSFVPLGPAANQVLVQTEDVARALERVQATLEGH